MRRISPREHDLIRCFLKGMRNKEIATVLHLTESTVKVYSSKLYAKLGVDGRFGLVAWARVHTPYNFEDGINIPTYQAWLEIGKGLQFTIPMILETLTIMLESETVSPEPIQTPSAPSIPSPS